MILLLVLTETDNQLYDSYSCTSSSCFCCYYYVLDIMKAGDLRRGDPLGLILVPTRELCCQIYDDARKVTCIVFLDTSYNDAALCCSAHLSI